MSNMTFLLLIAIKDMFLSKKKNGHPIASFLVKTNFLRALSKLIVLENIFFQMRISLSILQHKNQIATGSL